MRDAVTDVSAGPLGQLDEFGENFGGDAEDYADGVADGVESGAFGEPGSEGYNAAMRGVHNDIIDDLNSEDEGTRQDAEAAKEALQDRGLWDEEYEEERQEELEEEEAEEEEDADEEEPKDDLPEEGPVDDPADDDPLIIDLDGDGIELVSLDDSTAHFDLNVDGYAERIGWVHADDGLLVVDTNGNGLIDNGTEVFGDQAGFSNGFEQLASLDGNQDGVIDASDAAFGSLLV